MLRGTIPLGHVAGIRLGAHWSALVTLGLFTLLLGRSLAEAHGSSVAVWSIAALGAIGLLAALVAHELAHSLVARRQGVRVERVTLWLLGGVSELGAEPQTPRADLRIALAGPLTSLLIGGSAFVAAVAVGTMTRGPVLDVLVWLAAMNLILAVFNLLPGAPLDGGRVLRALVWRHTGDQFYAVTVAARSGRMLGLGLLGLGAVELLVVGDGAGIWLGLLGWFLFRAANMELAAAGLRHQLGDIRVRDVMSTNPLAIPATWTVAKLLDSPLAHSNHRVFPVVDQDGRPLGVLSWSDLTPLPAATRPMVAVRSVLRPVSAGAKATEDELLSAVASRAVLRPDLDIITVVDTLGRLTGVISATDLTMACHRSALGVPIHRIDRAQPPNARW